MSILISLAAEFVGKKAFKEADTAVNKFEKSVKKLGKSLGLGLSTAAIVAYGKASVKAYAADEAAARRLATAVDNLGYSLQKTRVEEFIKNTESSAGILDDKLRPAFQALLTTTGSLTQSQVLLNDAIQISRATGTELVTVAQDLANGYVGITRGLKKYNTGLTQAELKSKSFNEILGILLKNSAGAAEEYLSSTSYKLDVLSVAAANAQETIGKGLVDAFARIGGGTEAKDAAHAIDSIAKAVNAVTLALGFTIGAINKFRQGYTNFLMDPFGTGMPTQGTSTNRSASPAGTARRIAQQTAAESAAKKRAKELLTAQTKNTAELKKQAALKKAGTLFDMEQIQIIAALKGKISADDRKRLELQLALATENTDQVAKLAKELAISQGLGTELAAFLANLPSAKNPFEAWKNFLDGIESQAARIANMQFNVSAGMANFQYTLPTGNFTYGQGNPLNTSVFVQPQQPNAPSTVVVNVAGSVTTSQSLIDEIRGGLNVAALSGSSANVERRIGGW